MGRKINHLPLLPMFSGVVAGIVLCDIFGGWVGATVAIATLIVSVLRGWNIVVGVMAGVAVGWISMSFNKVELPETLPDDKDRITGRICSVREVNAGRSMVMETNGMRVMLTVPGLLPEVAVDDIVSITGHWSEPIFPTDLPGEENGSRSARRERLSMRCFVAHDSLVVIEHESTLAGTMWRWRNSLIDILLNSDLSEGASQLVTAVITGEDEMLDENSRERFASAGVAHILALSGAHVAVLTLLLGWMLLPLSLMGLRKWRWGVTILLLWLFALMVGMPASVVRSVIMATVILAGMILERPRSGINGWCLAGILILIFRPWELWSAGFQLTFLATLAILVVAPLLSRLKIKEFLIRWIVTSIGVTLAATVATGFVSAWHFHEFPLMFIVGNLIMVVLMPVLLVGGVLVLLCGFMGNGGGWIADGVNWVYELTEKCIGGIASVDCGVVTDIYIPEWLVLVLVSATLVWLFALEMRKISVAVGAFLVLGWGVGVQSIGYSAEEGEELWVTREKDCTQLLLRRGNEMSIVRLSPLPVSEQDSIDLVERYGRYISQSGMARLNVNDDYSEVADSLGLLKIAGKRIALIGGDWKGMLPGALDYLIVTEGYRDSVAWLARDSVAKQILVGSDVNKIRAERYVRELREAGVDSWWIGDKPLHLKTR